jgi:hypothetical protein
MMQKQRLRFIINIHNSWKDMWKDIYYQSSFVDRPGSSQKIIERPGPTSNPANSNGFLQLNESGELLRKPFGPGPPGPNVKPRLVVDKSGTIRFAITTTTAFVRVTGGNGTRFT